VRHSSSKFFKQLSFPSNEVRDETLKTQSSKSFNMFERNFLLHFFFLGFFVENLFWRQRKNSSKFLEVSKKKAQLGSSKDRFVQNKDESLFFSDFVEIFQLISSQAID